MELARSCRYAVQGLVHLAQKARPGEPLLLRDIAAAIGAPEAFLSKIFQGLRAAAIVRSHRGIARGYSLAKDPAMIALYDVVLATEGQASLHSSDLFGGGKGEEAFTSLWRDVENVVAARLRQTTLKDLASPPQGKTEKTEA